jgi:hypothetical protein
MAREPDEPESKARDALPFSPKAAGRRDRRRDLRGGTRLIAARFRVGTRLMVRRRDVEIEAQIQGRRALRDREPEW